MPTYEKTFLGRQPILDRREQIYGYELLFRASEHATEAVFDDGDQASTQVLVDVFAGMGAETVLGACQGFVNVSRAMLQEEALLALPRDRVVLELLEDVPPDVDTVSRCQALREEGFRLALDDFVPDDPRLALVHMVDMVKVDLVGLGEAQIARLVRQIRAPNRSLIAEKVETREQFETCARLGFEYFQGYYFAKPTTLTGWRAAPENAAIMALLADLSRGSDIEAIENRFKRNPDLSLNLLRIVNSAGCVGRHKIQSIGHALVYLGLDPLRRWLLLMLYACSGGRDRAAALFNLAAVRGRILEILEAREPGAAAEGTDGEAGFLVGMLSLVGALMGRDAKEVLTELRVDDGIRRAVLDHAGDLGSLLSVVERLEQGDFEELNALLEDRGISSEELIAAQRNAYAWVNDLEQSLTP